MFSFRNFQRIDYSRAALAPSLILAHDTGLGKTLAAFTIPLLWLGWSASEGKSEKEEGKRNTRLVPSKAVLLVVPGDLHDNFAEEGREKFKTEIVRLTDQQAVLDLIRRDATGAPSLPPAFYITSYHQFAMNGVRDYPALGIGGAPALMAQWGWSDGPADAWFETRGDRYRDDYQRLGSTTGMALGAVQAATRQAEAVVRKNSRDYNSSWTDRELGAIALSLSRLENFHGPLPGMARPQLTAVQQAYILQGWLNDFLSDCQEGIHEQRTYQARESQVAGCKLQVEDDAPAAAQPGTLNLKPSTHPAHTITCVFAPAMVDLCGGLFAAAVVDEGVRMKSDDSIIGLGLRRLNPPHRMVLSATPIKNRLPDLFWPAQWVGGMDGANARWPYEATSDAKEEFIEEFMVRESNLTQAHNAGVAVLMKNIGSKHKKRLVVPKRFQKSTPECCNLHRLWKLVTPILLRRRKDDIGEDIVKKVFHQLDVPLGTTHAAVYRYHLENDYTSIDRRGREMKNAATKLMALRQASACPHTANLKPQAGGQPEHHQSPHVWTPKLMACLTLLRDQMRLGRQGVVFSAFREPLTDLAGLLAEAGVRSAVLNGDVSPVKRGALSAQFKAGRSQVAGCKLQVPGATDAGSQPATFNLQPETRSLPVVLCGIESTAEGHNWPNARYVVRFDLAQALDKNVQGPNRVHRLTSPEDVDVYDLVNRGTVDLRLRELAQKKGDTSDLVLDGRLMGEAREELNIQELLKHAVATFDAGGTVPEASLVARWPALREELRAAQRAWDAGTTATTAAPTTAASFRFPAPAGAAPAVHAALAWLSKLQAGRV